MKKLLPLILLLIFAAFYVHAEEELADFRLEVMDFTELKITDNINVDYHCSEDSAGWVYFSAERDVAPQLLFTNNKSCLHIQVALDAIETDKLPVIHVYSSSLCKVENASDSTVRILNNVPVKVFKGKLIGNGTLIINGVEAASFDANLSTGKGHIVINNSIAQRAKLSDIGTGYIEAGGLSAKFVKAILFGTGDVDCTVSDELSVYGAGSATVFYKGKPSKIINRSIGIKTITVELPDNPDETPE